MLRYARTATAVAICLLAGASLAHAQASRTWVSGVGDDDNPCSRYAPCKTFAAALDATADGGEISALDPGGFGALTINKSITISGDGTLASILANGTNAVTVNGPGIIVTLRNLSLLGPNGTGLKGIELLDGALIVDHVTISGFETGISTTSGNAMVVRSTITRNSGFGIRAIGGSITLENSTLSSNGVGAQVDTNANINLANNGIYSNLTGFGCGGGLLASAGDNRKGNNVGGGAPACGPNATVPLK